MTLYMKKKPAVYQARAYYGQGEGTASAIESWLASFYPSADYVEVTEEYDSSIDQMVLTVKVGDTGPVDPNTQGIQVTMGEWLLVGEGYFAGKLSYDQLTVMFEII